MKIHEYNEMMAWLKKPKRLFSSRKDTIGGGAIQGEDLGSRMGFAGPVLLKTGENKGKYKVRFRDPKFGKREGQSGFNEGDKFFATKEEADAFYQDLLSKKDEKKAAGLAKKNVAVEKQAKQINDFVNTFVDKNITNFDVRDYVNFRKDLLKEFNKTKIGYASGRNALYKGLPNVGIEEAENYFKKLFYTNKINSDPTFQKRIGDYLEYYNIDKKFYGGSELDKEAKILARKQYADVLDNAGDVLFVLGDDKVGIGKFRSSIVKQFFPEEMEIYNRKKQASGAAYEEKLAQIEERLGPKKLKQVLNGETSIKRFMTKQSDILKDIFDLSTLDEGLRFNLDHAEGIAEIAKMENSNDIMRALNNLIGMTQSRNYELGWRGYSTSRKNLLNKIEQGIDVDKSLKQLNDLTKSVYPETQGKDAYKIIKGKVTPTKNFQFMYEPEKAFGQYFMEIGGTEKGTEQIIRQAAENPQLEKFITEIEGGNFYALKYGPKAAKEFFEAQGIDTEPYLKGMAPILYMKQGGRIQLADGGRLSFAEGPEDPKKRATLKKIGIGGGLTAAVGTGLINLLDLFKGGAKTGVVATKAAQSQAEKLFFDLVNAVKNKGILKKLDQMTDFSRGGAYYEYKGVKVLEDGENIELQFTTDKGAPAVVEYRKPGYDVDPEAGTSYKVPGEFTNEGQEIARYGQDGDVDIDFENEIIDPIENVKKIIDD
jgi:hypothetical protein